MVHLRCAIQWKQLWFNLLTVWGFVCWSRQSFSTLLCYLSIFKRLIIYKNSFLCSETRNSQRYFRLTLSPFWNVSPPHSSVIWQSMWKIFWQQLQLNLTHSQILEHKMQAQVRMWKFKIQIFCIIAKTRFAFKPVIHKSCAQYWSWRPPSIERFVRTWSLFRKGLPLFNTKMIPVVNKFFSRVQRNLLESAIPISLAMYWLILGAPIVHNWSLFAMRLVHSTISLQFSRLEVGKL